MDRRSRVTQREPETAQLVSEALNRRIELHTCRQHHTVLRHILNEFPASEPLPGPIMVVLLGRLKAILLRHLRLEDDYVYPSLSQSPDETLRAAALQCRIEMGGILRAFENFIARWPHAEAIDRDPTGFFDEWRPLRKALEMRMDAEDHTLYRKAESYFNDILEHS